MQYFSNDYKVPCTNGAVQIRNKTEEKTNKVPNQNKMKDKIGRDLVIEKYIENRVIQIDCCLKTSDTFGIRKKDTTKLEKYIFLAKLIYIYI